MTKRDFISLADFAKAELDTIIDAALKHVTLPTR